MVTKKDPFGGIIGCWNLSRDIMRYCKNCPFRKNKKKCKEFREKNRMMEVHKGAR